MQLSSEQTPHPQLYRPQHRHERGPTEELGTPPAPIPHPAAPPVLPPHSAPLGAEHTQGCPSPSQPHGDSNVPAAPAPPPTLAWRYPEGSADPTGHSGPHVLPGPGWTPTPTSPLIPTWTRMGPHGRAITPPRSHLTDPPVPPPHVEQNTPRAAPTPRGQRCHGAPPDSPLPRYPPPLAHRGLQPRPAATRTPWAWTDGSGGLRSPGGCSGVPRPRRARSLRRAAPLCAPPTRAVPRNSSGPGCGAAWEAPEADPAAAAPAERGVGGGSERGGNSGTALSPPNRTGTGGSGCARGVRRHRGSRRAERGEPTAAEQWGSGVGGPGGLRSGQPEPAGGGHRDPGRPRI